MDYWSGDEDDTMQVEEEPSDEEGSDKELEAECDSDHEMDNNPRIDHNDPKKPKRRRRNVDMASKAATKKKRKRKTKASSTQSPPSSPPDDVEWKEVDPDTWTSSTFKNDDYTSTEGLPHSRYTAHLSASSEPIEFFNLFFPPSLRETIANNTNAYYKTRKAREPGLYPDWKDTSQAEIDRFFAVVMKHAVCPQPQTRLRFTDPRKSFFFGDERDRRLFGARRFQQLRSLITFYKPTGPVDVQSDPLAKARDVLMCLRARCRKYWTPGVVLAGNEQTVYVRARWKHKKRIKYKKHGDGVQVSNTARPALLWDVATNNPFLLPQVEALCDRGYTYDFIFRMEKAPHVDVPGLDYKSMSDTTKRVIYLLSELPKETQHLVLYDNFYISLKFITAAKKVGKRVGGTCWQGKRGLPAIVKISTEGMSEAELDSNRGKLIKAAEYGEGGITAYGVLDKGNKATYFMGNVWSSLAKIAKTKQVWSKEADSWVDDERSISWVQEFNNMWMNSVDIADQLRDNYRHGGSYFRVLKWPLSIAMLIKCTAVRPRRRGEIQSHRSTSGRP